MSELLIIAEAGVNHNGSVERALDMVDLAAAAGADAVKFQTFSADKLARRDAQLAEYQRTSSDDTRTQWDLLKQLELAHDEFAAIRNRCAERGIMFLSTGFDLDELDFLIDELAIPIVKVASGDLTFAPMLVQAGRTGLPVILSTGMADLDEIATALRFIAVGIAQQLGEVPYPLAVTSDVRASVWQSPTVQQTLHERVTILHCTTQYPAPASALNLRAMASIADAFGLPVGYSDHSLGATASTLAVALGAVAIEKHFTLDTTLPGPDHAASLDPEGLVDFVAQLRLAETMLGSPVKECQPEEELNRSVVRRSVTAAQAISAGEVITEQSVECRRPGDGRTAFEFWDVVGTVATRDYAEGDYVS